MNNFMCFQNLNIPVGDDEESVKQRLQIRLDLYARIPACKEIIANHCRGGTDILDRMPTTGDKEGFIPYRASFTYTLVYKSIIESDLWGERDLLGVPKREYLLVKVMPYKLEKPKEYRENVVEIFIKDALVPYCILADVNKILRNHCLDEVFFPKIYFKNLRESAKNDEEVVIVQDVAKYGYELHDYTQHMSEKKAVVAIKEYAKLHAGFYILEQQEGWKIGHVEELTTYPQRTELDLYKKFSDNYVEKLLKSSMMCMDGKPKLKKSKPDKKELPKQYINFMKEIGNSPFRTLTHGSIGCNHLYFNGPVGRETGACLSGFGGAKIGNLTADINNFFFVCLSDVGRRNMKKKLLEIYYITFADIVRTANRVMPFTREELKKEVEDNVMWGWFAALNSLPSYIGGINHGPNLKLFATATVKDFTEEKEATIKELFTHNQEFKHRFSDIYKQILVIVNAVDKVDAALDAKGAAGESSGLGKVESGESSGLGKGESGESSGLGKGESGESSGLGKGESGESSGLGKGESGESLGLGKAESGESLGIAKGEKDDSA